MIYAIGMFTVMSCVCMYVYNYAYNKGFDDGANSNYEYKEDE